MTKMIFLTALLVSAQAFAVKGTVKEVYSRLAVQQTAESCSARYAVQEKIINSQIDPALGVSVKLGPCSLEEGGGLDKTLDVPVELTGRECNVGKYTKYQMTTSVHTINGDVSPTLFTELGILNFGVDAGQDGYILAIPSCN